MSLEEVQLVRMVFAWIDSFGPGTVDLQIDPDLSEAEANEVFQVIAET